MARYQRQFGLNGGLPSTGQSGAYQRLAQSLDGFGAQMNRMGATLNAAAGQRDAAAVEPSTEAPELRSPLTAYGANYNAQVLEGHLAATRNSYQMQLDGLAEKNAVDPDGFAGAANEIRGAILQGVSPEIRAAVAVNFDRDANSHLLNIQRTQAKTAAIEARAEVEDAFDGIEATIRRQIRQGDTDGAAEQIAEYRAAIAASAVLSDDEKRDRLAKLENDSIEQALLADLDDLDVAEAYGYLDRAAGEIPDSFAPEEWDKVIGRAQTVLKQRVARDNKILDEVRKQHAREVSDLEVAIDAGVGDPQEQVDQIERLFDSEIIDGSKRTSLLKQINDQAEKSLDESAKLGMVMDRLNGDDSLVIPSQDVDAVYQKHFSDGANANKAIFADRMKYVPKGMRAEVVNGLRSGNSELITKSADLLDRLDAIPGIPENSFTKQDRAFASTLMEFMQYLPADEAVEMARKNTDPNDKARIDARRELYAAEFDNKPERLEDNLSEVEDRFDFEIFGNTVDELTRYQLAQDFDRLAEEYYIAGMDMDKAKDQAEQDMKRVWGVSNITGEGRTMRYPPENYYGAGDNEWMQAQLTSEVAEVWPGEYSRLHIRADGITAREASHGKPTYVVVVEDENGLTPLVQYRWQPDRSEAAAAIEAEQKQKFEERRARIAQMQSGTAEGEQRRRLMGPGEATRRALER